MRLKLTDVVRRLVETRRRKAESRRAKLNQQLLDAAQKRERDPR
jgi:hypothetical protein